MDLRFRFWVIFGVVIFIFLSLLPTVLPSVFSDETRLGKAWISKPLKLGLDLKGGAYFLFEIDKESFSKVYIDKEIKALRSVFNQNNIAFSSVSKEDKETVRVVFLTSTSLQRALNLIEGLDRWRLQARGEDYLVIRYKFDHFEKIIKAAADTAVEVIRTRVDQFGVAEPVIQRVGIDKILVEVPGVVDQTKLKSVLGRVAQLEFRFLPRSQGVPTIKLPVARSGEFLEVEDEIVLTGDLIQTASVEFDPQHGSVVLINFNPQGSREFAKITRENIGKQLAIILDGVIYSYPTIQSVIAEGSAMITGLKNWEEAKELVVVLRSGTLPAPVKILEEKIVGPTLGKIYVERAVYALISSFLAVSILMIFLYKIGGLVASLSLLLNLGIIVSLLSVLGATLTFPGLAALALTLGIAVDSNIIIFERIKDFLKSGFETDSAVEEGFQNAYSAIFDANITSLIISFIVYFLSHGPIRGFAVVFGIGTIATLFCAVFFSKALLSLLSSRGKIQL